MKLSDGTHSANRLKMSIIHSFRGILFCTITLDNATGMESGIWYVKVFGACQSAVLATFTPPSSGLLYRRCRVRWRILNYTHAFARAHLISFALQLMQDGKVTVLLEKK